MLLLQFEDSVTLFFFGGFAADPPGFFGNASAILRNTAVMPLGFVAIVLPPIVPSIGIKWLALAPVAP